MELDPQEMIFPDEQNKLEKAIERRRDVLKQYPSIMYDRKNIYCIIGIENQTYVNYQGPFTALSYDYFRVYRQIVQIQDTHEKEKDLSGDELMSKFSREDKIIPVITITIHFSGKIWDGPKYLHEMYVGEHDEAFKSLCMDYKMNMIEPARMDDEEFNKFETDLGIVLQFSKHTENKKAMKVYLKNPIFEDIDVKAVRVINAIGNLGMNITPRAGRMNMCKAIEELKQDWKEEARAEGLEEGRAEGRAEGREEGRTEGALSSLLTNVKTVMQKMHISSSEAMDFLDVSNDTRNVLMKML